MIGLSRGLSRNYFLRIIKAVFMPARLRLDILIIEGPLLDADHRLVWGASDET